MGFKPPMQYDHTLHQLLLAHQIQEDAGLEIEYGSIHYIIGNVWNTLTHNFEPGPGANIIINENITQDDINNINKAHRKDHLSGLIFLLGHKCKSDYNNNNWYRTDIENTIAFDRFTIPHSLTTTQKVNDKPIKYMPPTMQSTLLPNKNTSPHPKNNNKLIKKYDKILGDDTSYSTSQTQEKQHYIPSSERHTCAPTGHTAHRRKFKCNILNNLNKKIQQNIKYNQNINDITSITTPTILPENPNIIHKSIAPFTQLNQHPHTDPPNDISIDPTLPNGNNNADNAALNKTLNINKNKSQNNNYAIMRALTHYNSTEVGMLNSEDAPLKDIIFNSLGTEILPSIKQSLTSNGYVLNDNNENRFEPRTFFAAVISAKEDINKKS